MCDPLRINFRFSTWGLQVCKYLTNGSQSTSNNGIRYKSPEKKALTSAIELLRGYYGLPSMTWGGSEGTKMDVYKTDVEFLYVDQPHVPHVKLALNAHNILGVCMSSH
jgi:hypothetical protein